MTTKTTPATNADLAAADDFVDDLVDEVQAEPTKQSEPQWNGRRTRIRLAHPVLRGTVAKPEGRFLDGAANPEIERQSKRDEAAAVASGLATAIEPLVEAIREKLVATPAEK